MRGVAGVRGDHGVTARVGRGRGAHVPLAHRGGAHIEERNLGALDRVVVRVGDGGGRALCRAVIGERVARDRHLALAAADGEGAADGLGEVVAADDRRGLGVDTRDARSLAAEVRLALCGDAGIRDVDVGLPGDVLIAIEGIGAEGEVLRLFIGKSLVRQLMLPLEADVGRLWRDGQVAHAHGCLVVAARSGGDGHVDAGLGGGAAEGDRGRTEAILRERVQHGLEAVDDLLGVLDAGELEHRREGGHRRIVVDDLGELA